MLKIALRYKPNFVCLVPENRKEITTEGGINIIKNYNIIKKTISKLNDKKIRTSLFINPNYKDIKLSHRIGSKCIELHTGRISELIKSKKKYSFELQKIKKCANYAKSLGLEVHAGHGIDYKTASILSNIKHIKEFNIGHFIIGESVINGMAKVIKKFKSI
jgi:pyridoxine 5-phosphate synthase